jgi:nucleotide-binding universal stress UspA family protein
VTHATVPPYRCILVAVDGTDTAELAFGHALRLAKHHRARLHVVHVVEAYRCAESFAGPDEPDVAAALEALRQDGRRLLTEARTRAAGAGVQVETALLQTHALTERPAAALAAEAGRINADLIVIGTHGLRNSERSTLGSVAEALIGNTTVPVLLLRPAPRQQTGDLQK